MHKKELKKILRPLIKECVREIIFEEGALSTIISEVMKGTSSQKVVYENKQTQPTPQINERKRSQLLEQKRKMLDAIGKDAYNGVDLFEGTSPIKGGSTSQGSQPGKALDGVDPRDPGVDLKSFGLPADVWKKLAGS